MSIAIRFKRFVPVFLIPLFVAASTFAAGPSITAQPQSNGVATGQTMPPFNVTGNGGGLTLSYQWYQGPASGGHPGDTGVIMLSDINSPISSGPYAGETVSGSTTASLSLGNLPLGASESYVFVIVSDSGGSTSSDGTSEVTVFESAAYIDTQPAGTSVTAGGTASITVVGGGGPLPAFEWRKNGVDLVPGTQGSGSTVSISVNYDASSQLTSSTLTISNAQAGDAGTAPTTTTGTGYDVIVKNTTGGLPNNITSNRVALGFTQGSQTITFGKPNDTNYTANPITLSATATSGLTVAFSITSGPATVSGSSLTLTGVGTVTVKASQAGNASYAAASPVSQSFVVSKANQAPPAIYAPTSITFGDSLTATANTGIGALTWTLGTGSTAASAAITTGGVVSYTSVGNIFINAMFAGDANHNSATTTNFKIAVNPAPVTFALSSAAFNYSGVAQGPTINATPSNATFTPGGTTSATAAGNYNATATATGNYTGTNSTLAWSVAKAPLTVTANNKKRAVGVANPAFTVSYSGFVNSESASSLTTQPTATTTATTGSPAGNYPITASGGVSTNYAFTYVSGTLVVGTTVSDFNGDGHPDLLWENTSTGDRAIWYLDGTGIGSFGYLAGIPIEWKIVATADFDGDGQTDILWEDTTTGDRSIWLMNGTTILNFAYLAYVDPVWHIAAVGDFNGDGHPDVIWENNSTGDRAIWFLNGTGIDSFGYIAGISTDWHIVGAADIDGDGQTDLIWENLVTGDRTVWFMNGATLSSFGYIANIPGAWHIAMVADFDNDGHPDLLWENTTTGDRAIWLMNGTTQLSAPYLAYVDPVWRVAP